LMNRRNHKQGVMNRCSSNHCFEESGSADLRSGRKCGNSITSSHSQRGFSKVGKGYLKIKSTVSTVFSCKSPKVAATPKTVNLSSPGELM
jgi:hypothetical protein